MQSDQKKKNSSVKKTETSNVSTKKSKKTASPFPVAGIGASAGGLEAIKLLLQHLPDNTGIAYVIVQHLAPHFESILPKLLEKETSMKVHKVEDKIPLKVNEIFVIPPDTYMDIVDGHLTLFPRESKRGIFLPIDYFFKKLAKLYRNKAIGILLSGTGSDGTQGFKDIKAEGGYWHFKRNAEKPF